VIFDPAPYIGDREADLAMASLFGGFPPAFYEAYDLAFPLEKEGLEDRRVVYQLYHVMNHYAMFGGSYLQQARNSCERILRM